MEKVGNTMADVGPGADKAAGGVDVDPIRWLSPILWPDGDARLLVDRRRDRAGTDNAHVMTAGDGDQGVGFRWWASPNPSSAEILIPATSIAAARTAVRRYHDGLNLKRRARSWAAELLMRSPVTAHRVLDSTLVAATGRVDEGLLLDLARAMAETAPIRELHVAITLARPKSNRKPVLQLIDHDGTCVGWAKIGWNQWTTELLANEAAWLDRARTRQPGAPLATPHVKARLNLRGQTVLVTSGFVGRRRPRLSPHEPPRPELFLAISDLGTRDRMPLTETPWWNSVQDVIGFATDDEVRAIERVARTVGSATLEIGAWHGDLTPWNILSPDQSGRTPGVFAQVIDWEYAADGVPLGFDLCHFHTQVGAEMKHLSPGDALDRSARLSPQGLARLGVDPHNQINVYRLYLVELIRRTLALRATGVSVEEVEQGAAATERIRKSGR